MTIVPTKVSLISGVAVVASVGVLLTLVHRPVAANATAYHADTSTSADITPALTSLGTPQISVNGLAVPATTGTTTVPMPSGSATVTVSGNSATVSTSDNNVSQTTSDGSGNLNISVHSSSNGNNTTSSHTTVSSHSFVNSSSSSNGSSVTVETH